ncbi:MAG: V-type ATPase subunit [Spirochaetes bacterium]|nr:V-type ATPase subunit [Spirochaetota bacterium]
MNYYADRNYIHAGIYALHSALFDRGALIDIIKSGSLHSIHPEIDKEIALKNTGRVFELIFESQSARIMRLTEASASTRGLFMLFLRYFEIHNLKLLCREAFGMRPEPSAWYNTGVHAALHRAPGITAGGIKVLVEYTRLTWMKDFFPEEDITGFAFAEYCIDKAVLDRAADFILTMNHRDSRDAMKLLAGYIAFMRITWGNRLKTIYNILPGSEPAFASTVMWPRNTGSKFKRIVREQEKMLLKKTGGADIEDSESLSTLEKKMERVLFAEVRRMFYHDFHSRNTVACYLLLLYRQIRNLSAIAEGLRLGLDAETIMENVICEE